MQLPFVVGSNGFQQAGPFEKTLKTLLLRQVLIVFSEWKSWVGMK